MAEPFACPVCKRPVPLAEEERPATFPFCSQRCRTIDLGAWASGAYVVPGRPIDDASQAVDRPEKPAP